MTDASEHAFSTEVQPADDPGVLGQAVELLGQGQLVALPTETVYGLAADARSPGAVARIFEAKGRPAGNPLIVHIDSVEMAEGCVAARPRAAAQLAGAFWPGPLSLVLPKADSIPDIVTAGGKTVAVRCPAHPVFRAVLAKCGFPLAAPSANRSNRVSPTRAEHVVDQLGGRIPLVLDGGACDLGIESTVLDLTGDTPTLLRPWLIPTLTTREHPRAQKGLGVAGQVSHGGPHAEAARPPVLHPRDPVTESIDHELRPRPRLTL